MALDPVHHRLRCIRHAGVSVMDPKDRRVNVPIQRRTPGLSEPTPQHVDDLLDEALDESFPASDPVAISPDRPKERKRDTDAR